MDAKQFIEKHSYYPLHKTHLKTNKSFKFFETGLVCYEETKTAYVVAGDPVCTKKTDVAKVLDEFVLWAKEQGKLVCGYYFSDYVANKCKLLTPYFAGVTVGCDLAEFKLTGKGASEVRRSLNYGQRRELKFKELNRSEYFEHFFELKNLESKWYKNKSSYKKIKFLLSPLKVDSQKVSDRNFVILNKKNKIISYVSLDQFREPKKQLSYYVDHMFQDPKQYRLALDFLIASLLVNLKKENHKYLDLGFCPFHKVKPKSLIESGLFLSNQINYLYNSKGIYKYKKKFSNYQKPGYILVDPGYSKVKQMFVLREVTFS